MKFEDWKELQNGSDIRGVAMEGIRVQCQGVDEKGWFLLRMSLHDPVMPLNVESNVKGGVDAIRKRLKKSMRAFNELDIEAL